jgi:hypothetical protein
MNNITMHFELNLDFIELKSNTLNGIWIQLTTNDMWIDGEGIQNLLVNMELEKKTLKRHNSKKTPFHVSSLGNGLNKL